MSKRIVIVGAGYAGIEAALHLNRKGKKDDLDIRIIDKNPYHTLLTELHEVAGNRQDKEAVRIPLRDIFRDTKVRWIMDEIKEFRFEENRLIGEKQTYEFDHCIMAIGSSPAYYGIDGMREHSFSLWSFDDAVKIRDHIKDCFCKASQEEDEKERAKLLTFIVGGAGFTGVEMVGELAHWVKKLCKDHDIDGKEVRLILIDMLDRVLPMLHQKNSSKAYRYMTKKLGIEVMLETNISKMEEGTVHTSRGDIDTATMIWCAGVGCNEDACGIDFDRINRSQRFSVNEYCQTEKENVYAVGDCGGLTDEDGHPHAAMVENAIQTGRGAAQNILHALRDEDLVPVEVKFHGTMVSVGNYFAVSEIMGKKLPSWLSMVMKYLVNAHYLFEIMGLRGPARYLKEEVVNRKQKKRFLARHYSPKMQAWWLMPLRMFTGAIWLYEGVKKIFEGWLTNPTLAEFTGFTRGYDLDAISGATPGGLRMDTIFRLNLRIFDFRLGEATQIMDGSAVGSDLFVKMDLLRFGNFSFVPWIVENWSLSSQGWELFFQIMVVLAEVLVGLMLLAGAFTFPAAVVSAGLIGIFVTSTGLYMENWWILFASIALMGGAGRAFGMDNYLIPWWTRVWEHLWKNRRLKLIFPKRK